MHPKLGIVIVQDYYYMYVSNLNSLKKETSMLFRFWKVKDFWIKDQRSQFIVKI